MMNVLCLYMNKKFNRKLCMYAFAGGGRGGERGGRAIVPAMKTEKKNK